MVVSRYIDVKRLDGA